MIASSEKTDPKIVPLIIGGIDEVTTTTFGVTSPATGIFIHHCSSASVSSATRAAVAGQAAFQVWSRLKPTGRRDLLFKAADIAEARKDELFSARMDETAATKEQCEYEYNVGLEFLRDYAGRSLSLEGTVPVPAQDGQSAMTVKEPYGVILSIVPWNAPLILGLRAIAVPLAAGNTVLLKGSELCPKTFWLLGDIFREAGLPQGCLDVIYHQPSDAADITTALIAHPAIKKINFTGSTHVGSIIAAMAGKYIKPVLLELGGKCSCIVLDDADLNKAAAGSVLGAFVQAGQVCMSTERIIVQRSVADAFRKVLTETTERIFGKHTPPQILISGAAVQRNKALVSNAVAKGAQLLYGDHKPQEATATCLRPMVVENVTRDMDLYFTESFGPTVSLYVVDTEDQAIELANDTEYGLTVAVYSENLRRGLRMQDRLKLGTTPLLHVKVSHYT